MSAKSALFFPAPSSLDDKWWHRLATAIFWVWFSICTLVVVAFSAFLIYAIAAINDPSVEQLGSDAGDPTYCLIVIITWSILYFLPSLVYRAILFVTKGNSWKDDVSAAQREEGKKQKVSEVRIIKGENMRSYSVADELSKWAKLKDEGVVSEQEFQEARNKILQSQ